MMNYLAFQLHGKTDFGGFAAMTGEFLEFLENLFNKTPPEMLTTLLPGIGRMDNLHPLFVHFPIAFFMGFFLLDFLGSWRSKPHWRYAASCMLYLGTVAAILAVMAGLSAADSVEHNDIVHDIMETHEHIGITVVIFALLLTVWRAKNWSQGSVFWNRVFLGLSASLCVLISFGADLGGLMVYGHGVGTNLSSETKMLNDAATVKSEHESGHNHGGHDHSGHGHGGHHHSD